jgi:hypothetical protein
VQVEDVGNGTEQTQPNTKVIAQISPFLLTLTPQYFVIQPETWPKYSYHHEKMHTHQKSPDFYMCQDKKTFTQIGAKLGLSHTTISRTYHKLKKQGENPDFYLKKDIPGRPQLLTPHAEQRAAQAITSGECMDATDIQHTLFPNISASTLHRMFLRKGMKGRIHWKNPWLSKIHVQQQFQWAKLLLNQSICFWKCVWFTDESKFNLFGSDGKQYCRRRDEEAMVDRNLWKTIKHGGRSVMVWACISWNGPGCIHLVDGNMNTAQYCSILSTSLLGSFEDENLGPQDIIFQQDNDPKHTS